MNRQEALEMLQLMKVIRRYYLAQPVIAAAIVWANTDEEELDGKPEVICALADAVADWERSFV